MHRDQFNGQSKNEKSGFRKEWGRPLRNEHDSEPNDRGRYSAKLQRTYGVRQEEAVRQIRELRARY